MLNARAQTGWENWSDLELKVSLHNDLVVANGVYYGDWELMMRTPQEQFAQSSNNERL